MSETFEISAFLTGIKKISNNYSKFVMADSLVMLTAECFLHIVNNVLHKLR